MPKENFSEGYDYGNEFSRFLVAGDPHLWEDKMDAVRDGERIFDHGIKYGCTDLIIPGDVSKELEEVERFLDDSKLLFSSVKIAYGNNDEFQETGFPGVEVDDYLFWEEESVENYSIAVKHDPSRFDIGFRSCSSSNRNPATNDILVSAHNHDPVSEVLTDGLLYINPGSIYSNYSRNRSIPERSIFILDIGKEVEVRHLDYISGEVVETEKYVRKGNRFQEKEEFKISSPGLHSKTDKHGLRK